MIEPSHHGYGEPAVAGIRALSIYALMNGWERPRAGDEDLEYFQRVLTRLLSELVQAAHELPLDFPRAVERAQGDLFDQSRVAREPFPGVEISSGTINSAAQAERELVEVAARIEATEEAELPVPRSAIVDRQALTRALAVWRLRPESQILSELRPLIAAQRQLHDQAPGQAGVDFPPTAPTTSDAPVPVTPSNTSDAASPEAATHVRRSRGTS